MSQSLYINTYIWNIDIHFFMYHTLKKSFSTALPDAFVKSHIDLFLDSLFFSVDLYFYSHANTIVLMLNIFKRRLYL